MPTPNSLSAPEWQERGCVRNRPLREQPAIVDQTAQAWSSRQQEAAISQLGSRGSGLSALRHPEVETDLVKQAYPRSLLTPALSVNVAEATAAAEKREAERAEAARKQAEANAAAEERARQERAATVARIRATEQEAAQEHLEAEKLFNDRVVQEQVKSQTAAEQAVLARRTAEQYALARQQAEEEAAAAKRKVEEHLAAKKKAEQESAAARRKVDEHLAAAKRAEAEAAAARSRAIGLGSPTAQVAAAPEVSLALAAARMLAKSESPAKSPEPQSVDSGGGASGGHAAEQRVVDTVATAVQRQQESAREAEELLQASRFMSPPQQDRAAGHSQDRLEGSPKTPAAIEAEVKESQLISEAARSKFDSAKDELDQAMGMGQPAASLPYLPPSRFDSPGSHTAAEAVRPREVVVGGSPKSSGGANQADVVLEKDVNVVLEVSPAQGVRWRNSPVFEAVTSEPGPNVGNQLSGSVVAGSDGVEYLKVASNGLFVPLATKDNSIQILVPPGKGQSQSSPSPEPTSTLVTEQQPVEHKPAAGLSLLQQAEQDRQRREEAMGEIVDQQAGAWERRLQQAEQDRQSRQDDLREQYMRRMGVRSPSGGKPIESEVSHQTQALLAAPDRLSSHLAQPQVDEQSWSPTPLRSPREFEDMEVSEMALHIEALKRHKQTGLSRRSETLSSFELPTSMYAHPDPTMMAALRRFYGTKDPRTALLSDQELVRVAASNETMNAAIRTGRADVVARLVDMQLQAGPRGQSYRDARQMLAEAQQGLAQPAAPAPKAPSAELLRAARVLFHTKNKSMAYPMLQLSDEELLPIIKNNSHLHKLCLDHLSMEGEQAAKQPGETSPVTRHEDAEPNPANRNRQSLLSLLDRENEAAWAAKEKVRLAKHEQAAQVHAVPEPAPEPEPPLQEWEHSNHDLNEWYYEHKLQQAQASDWRPQAAPAGDSSWRDEPESNAGAVKTDISDFSDQFGELRRRYEAKTGISSSSMSDADFISVVIKDKEALRYLKANSR